MKPAFFFTTEAQRAQSNDPSAPATALASPACGWSRVDKGNPRVIVSGIVCRSVDQDFGVLRRILHAPSRLKCFVLNLSSSFRVLRSFSEGGLNRSSAARAFVVSILALTTALRAQTNTFPSSGSVGIGTTSPQNLLDVSATGVMQARILTTTSGSVNAAAWLIQRGDQSSGYAQTHYLTGSSVYNWSTGLRAGDGNYHVYDAVNNVDRLIVTPAGNVGIGTNSLNDKLHIYSPGNL